MNNFLRKILPDLNPPAGGGAPAAPEKPAEIPAEAAPDKPQSQPDATGKNGAEPAKAPDAQPKDEFTPDSPELGRHYSTLMAKLTPEERKVLQASYDYNIGKRLEGVRKKYDGTLGEKTAALTSLQQKLAEYEQKAPQQTFSLEIPEDLKATLTPEEQRLYNEILPGQLNKLLTPAMQRINELTEQLTDIRRPMAEKQQAEEALHFLSESKKFAPDVPEAQILAIKILNDQHGDEVDPVMVATQAQSDWLDSFGKAMQAGNPALQNQVAEFVKQNVGKDNPMMKQIELSVLNHYRENKDKLAELSDIVRAPQPEAEGAPTPGKTLANWAMES
ncbi:MAG: hypothetical protein RDU76_06280 [Candidatus Edwardsbacteria bacterium]|nr:hypothetical protein [Candidatus Edwardsbacteria bacterium]